MCPVKLRGEAQMSSSTSWKDTILGVLAELELLLVWLLVLRDLAIVGAG
jgi:hypothetical protein